MSSAFFDHLEQYKPEGGLASSADVSDIDDIFSALIGTEASGPDATSPKGARGTAQIMPDTFKQYAVKGENYNNEADRVKAARRKAEDDYAWASGLTDDPDQAKKLTAAAYFGGRGGAMLWAQGKGGSRNDGILDINGYVDRFTSKIGAKVNAAFSPAAPAQANLPDQDPGADMSRWNVGRTDEPMRASDYGNIATAGQVSAQEQSDASPFKTSAVRGWEAMTTGLGLWKDALIGDHESMAGRIKEFSQFDAENPMPSASTKFNADWRAEEYAKALMNIPGFAMANVEQLANMVPSMVGGIPGAVKGAAVGSGFGPMGTFIGGVLGFGAGSAPGTIAVEGGMHVLEKMTKDGVNPDNPAAVKSWLAGNRDALIEYGLIKGGTVAAFDTVSAALGGAIVARPAMALANAERNVLRSLGADLADPKAIAAATKTPQYKSAMAPFLAEYQASATTAGNAMRGAAAMALETGGEFGGEYVGTGVAGGGWNANEALLEGAMALGTSAVTTAGEFALAKAVRKPNSPLTNAANAAPPAVTQPPAGTPPAGTPPAGPGADPIDAPPSDPAAPGLDAAPASSGRGWGGYEQIVPTGDPGYDRTVETLGQFFGDFGNEKRLRSLGGEPADSIDQMRHVWERIINNPEAQPEMRRQAIQQALDKMDRINGLGTDVGESRLGSNFTMPPNEDVGPSAFDQNGRPQITDATGGAGEVFAGAGGVEQRRPALPGTNEDGTPWHEQNPEARALAQGIQSGALTPRDVGTAGLPRPAAPAPGAATIDQQVQDGVPLDQITATTPAAKARLKKLKKEAANGSKAPVTPAAAAPAVDAPGDQGRSDVVPGSPALAPTDGNVQPAPGRDIPAAVTEPRGGAAAPDGATGDGRPAVAKQPWQMTAAEFSAAAKSGKLVKATGQQSSREIEYEAARAGNETPLGYGEAAGYSPNDIAHFYANYPGLNAESGRRMLVKHALREGKPVPAEVLADYPDLKQEPAAAAPAPQPGGAAEEIDYEAAFDAAASELGKSVKAAADSTAPVKPAQPAPAAVQSPAETAQPPAKAAGVTLDDVPPKLMQKLKVPVERLVGDEIKTVEVSANEAIADLDEEIAAYEKLLACVKAAA